MRNGFVAVTMLLSTAAVASAQGVVAAVPKQEVRVTPDEVIARLMFFDRNHDGRVAIDELSERMQPLVTRGDRSGDEALDASEIRSLAQSPQLPTTVRNLASSGRYGFGDTVGQSSRMHIQSTIEDLRLAPEATQQAKGIGLAFADGMDAAARAHLREAVAPVLTPDQLTQFEADLKRFADMGSGSIFVSTINGPATQIVVRMAGADPAILLRKYMLTPEQIKVATAATEKFKAEQQLDDARRSALVAQLSGILTAEECDNVSAALARRPLVKGAGMVAVSGGGTELLNVTHALIVKEGVFAGPATVPSVP